MLVFLIIGRGHLEFLFGLIENQPILAVARHNLQVFERNGHDLLASVEPGPCVWLRAARREITSSSSWSIGATEYCSQLPKKALFRFICGQVEPNGHGDVNYTRGERPMAPSRYLVIQCGDA